MGRKVIWAPRSVVLLEEAANHVETDAPQAARELVAQALELGASLSELSDRGRAVPELHDDRHREVFVGSYRLVYRVTQDAVHIVAFVHGSRDFRSWWKRLRRNAAPN